MSKPGPRDKTRELGAPKSLDRFDISHVRRGDDRVSIGNTMLLSGVNKEDGWYYYYFQDKDMRIKEAFEGGYEAVRDHNNIVITRSRGEFQMVYMRIPEELRKIDLAKKVEKVNNDVRSKNELDKRAIVPDYLPGEEDGRKHVIERDRAADFDPLN